MSAILFTFLYVIFCLFGFLGYRRCALWIQKRRNFAPRPAESIINELTRISPDGSAGHVALFWQPYDVSGTQILQEIRTYIRSATRSIKIATFVLRGENIADELKRAASRGVDVQIILDGQQLDSGGCHPMALERDSDARTQGRHTIQCRIYSESRVCPSDRQEDMYGRKSYFASSKRQRKTMRGIFHKKCVIIDERIAVFGSSNVTEDSFRSHYENVVITNDPRCTKPLVQDFDRNWIKFGSALAK